MLEGGDVGLECVTQRLCKTGSLAAGGVVDRVGARCWRAEARNRRGPSSKGVGWGKYRDLSELVVVEHCTL